MPFAVPRAKYRARVIAGAPVLEEQELQVEIFDWMRSVELRNAKIFHVPNGRRLDRLDAAIVDRLGVTAGVADLAVMLEGGRQGWIELKAKRGTLDPHQRDFAADCARLGHCHAIGRSLREVLQILVGWGVTWVSRASGGNS